jgi:bisphosphoglycerate-independent phosphoglycerate mutase (AlkP superfamily)
LLFVNYKEPDASGHAANWQGYLNGIKACDDYVKQVWEFIQSDPMYKDKTTLFITNDHGRHLNGINDGFVSHGDNCEGCRHIYLYAFGPDFKQNVIETQQRELIDINATILELLGLDEQLSDGEVMTELFVN